MIFVSRGWPLETHDLHEIEMEKHKQKAEMKVKNERGNNSAHEGWKWSVKENLVNFTKHTHKVKTSESKWNTQEGREWLAVYRMRNINSLTR